MTDYTLDTKAARSADQTGSRISETGKYVGTLTRAERITGAKGTLGVEFSFKTDDGQSADYLSIWTKRNDGKDLYGFKQMQAIMVCCKQRSLTAVRGQAEKYDSSTGAIGTFNVDIFPELTGKRIGFLLQTEEYLKKDNTVGVKMAIAGVFDAETELTASEILDRITQPEKLQKMVALLRDRKLPATATRTDQGQAKPGQAEFDADEIPF